MQIAILVLLIACLIGYIWLAIVMFKRHYLWGSFFVLPAVIGFVAGFLSSKTLFLISNGLGIIAFLLLIVFAIKYWSLAKKAFLLYIISSFSLGGVIAVDVIDMMESPDVVAVLKKLEQGGITEQQAQEKIQAVIQQKFIEKYLDNSDSAAVSDDDLMTPEEQRIETLRAELQIKNDAAIASQEYAESRITIE